MRVGFFQSLCHVRPAIQFHVRRGLAGGRVVKVFQPPDVFVVHAKVREIAYAVAETLARPVLVGEQQRQAAGGSLVRGKSPVFIPTHQRETARGLQQLHHLRLAADVRLVAHKFSVNQL